jgi:hypothetical protein
MVIVTNTCHRGHNVAGKELKSSSKYRARLWLVRQRARTIRPQQPVTTKGGGGQQLLRHLAEKRRVGYRIAKVLLELSSL